MSYSKVLFFESLIRKLGHTPTPWRVAFFVEWERWENTGARFNPLATTRDGGEDPANPHWNTFRGSDGRTYHVRNYASFENGVQKTAETLELSYYPAVRAVIDAQMIPATIRPTLVSNIRTWGTTGFANKLAEGWSPTTPVQPPAEDGSPPPEGLAVEDLWLELQEVRRQLAEANDEAARRFDQVELAFEKLVDGAIAAQVAAQQANEG